MKNRKDDSGTGRIQSPQHRKEIAVTEQEAEDCGGKPPELAEPPVHGGCSQKYRNQKKEAEHNRQKIDMKQQSERFRKKTDDRNRIDQAVSGRWRQKIGPGKAGVGKPGDGPGIMEIPGQKIRFCPGQRELPQEQFVLSEVYRIEHRASKRSDHKGDQSTEHRSHAGKKRRME